MTYTHDELKEILRVHKLWLYGESGGKRADLSSADLSGADLRSANLSSADLSSANLSSADLRSADLSGADLRSANLSSADLSSANLSSANLSSANLRSADLSSADLSSANLRSANLRSAENLSPLMLARLRITPSEGALTGWKKARLSDGGVAIIKLLIPAEAKRSNAPGGRKCRAEFAEVVSINGETREVATSLHDPAFTYRPGERVTPHAWGVDPMEECAGGIHFYITREEAEAHF